MKDLRQLQLQIGALSDRELVGMLARPDENSQQAMSLAHLEADARSGLAALRGRLAPLPPMVLKAVGFWREEGGHFENCPLPQSLVRVGWPGDDLERILSFLREGQVCRRWLGYAQCRFAGCHDGRNIGSRELTDGEWVWPEGLPHYVERHAVRLPDEFVMRMRDLSWRVPALRLCDFQRPVYDYAPWVEWSRRLEIS